MNPLILILGVFGLIVGYNFLKGRGYIKNKGELHIDVTPKVTTHGQIDDVSSTDTYNKEVLPYPQVSNEYAPEGNFTQNMKLDCFPKDQLETKDLLPQQDGQTNAWDEVNPQGQGHLSHKNFIDAGYNFGVNTVSSTLKNANNQIRSDPIIPMKEVGPWMQSTYEADTNRKFFDIGESC